MVGSCFLPFHRWRVVIYVLFRFTFQSELELTRGKTLGHQPQKNKQ